MGLIRSVIGAGVSSVTSTLNDQWKEYFYCEALPNNVLVAKGRKKNTKNNKGSDNIISNGSKIAVADGQCMLIVDNGKVVDACAMAGEYIYDMSTEPSLFMDDGLKAVFKNGLGRFAYGGEAAKDQRIYFFNTKEITGNKYGTVQPIPFRVVDTNVGLDIDTSVKCFGEYSFRIANPILFYTNVCGNVNDTYLTSQIESQLKSELLTALQPAFAKISEMGIRYSALPGHTTELSEILNTILTEKWKDLRGLEIVSFGVSSVKVPEEDEKMIKELQRNAAFRNPNMAAAQLVGAQSSAMQSAAANANGAAMGFMGMNMAGAAGGFDAQSLFAMGQQQAAAQKPAADSWTCTCGAVNTGKFCKECGTKKPEQAAGWTCSCGAVNQGRFCSECGAKKPAGAIQYKCDKCGWAPKDPTKPPKFCPECGDPFGDEDIVS
ncbi:MAG: SPFH domain-containing protein [Eubacteriales bacterium]|nr:SPFH domain-containing protein [Eubacteriales bacterium]